MLKMKSVFLSVFANTLSAFIPEIWANESLLILEEEMVYGNLVNRDFNEEVASYGETVHTRRPSEFTASRKVDGDAVTTQDVTTTNVNVVLDQWIHVSFIIRDGEMTKAFKDLVKIYLLPAMQANARMLDQSLAAQCVRFLANRTGGLGQISSSTARDYLVNTRNVLNQHKAYNKGRALVLTSTTESEMLKTDLFTKANEVGDNGNALREAYLGRKFGFETYMDLNQPTCSAATTTTATTTAATTVAGAASVLLSAAKGIGQYVTIVGDYTPLRGTTATTTFTPTRPILKATTSGAAVTVYATGAVNFGAGYAAGWGKPIVVDGTGVPHVGQLVAFNTGDTATGTLLADEYVIIAVGAGNTSITLDRPLVAALSDNDAVCYGPNGEYNFAFHRNALTLVNRPLASPMDGVGAKAATAIYNNMSMRVVMTYDGVNQGHRITLDGLFGVQVLDTNLGCVLLG